MRDAVIRKCRRRKRHPHNDYVREPFNERVNVDASQQPELNGSSGYAVIPRSFEGHLTSVNGGRRELRVAVIART